MNSIRTLALCLLTAAPAAQADFIDPSQSITPAEIGPGVIAFIAPESNSMLVTGNSVAVIGDDGVLVVDSGHFPALAKKEIAEIKKRTDKPVRFLVNTHWHPDHVTGNAEFRKAFPNVVIVSTDYTRAQIAARDPKYSGSQAQFEQYSQTYREALRKGTNAEGRPLSSEDRQSMEQEAKNGEIAVREKIWEAPLTLPNAAFHELMSVYVGRREVRLMWLGRGNTGGDAVIYVPDSGIVITGDLVVLPTPYAYGSFLGDWRLTLHKMMSLGGTVVVPGHGPVQHDWSAVERLDKLLQSVLEQVGRGEAEGKSLADIRKTIDLEAFRRQYCGDDPARSRAFQAGFVEPATERAYQEIKLADEE